MLKLFLWLKYLRKKRIVLLSIAAVTLSVTLLIVVASLFTGFINAFERSAVDTIGDIVVTPPVKFAGYPLLFERFKQIKGIKAATAVLSSQGLLHLGDGNVRAVEIWGIQPAQRAAVTDFKQSLLMAKASAQSPSFATPGSTNKMGGYVGIGVIAEPNERTDEYDFESAKKIIGRQLVLTTGTITSTNADGQKQFKRKTIEFTVADIVFSGIYEIDKTFVYLPIEELQKALHPDEDGQLAQQIQIKLADGADIDVAAAQIRGIWEDFAGKKLGWDSYLIRSTNIETSRQMQSQYVAEFRKQMDVLLLIFGIVSFSVVLLVLCIFYMIVITRRKDIAIVKSCGAMNSSVAVIFVGFGVCIGLVGSFLGTILGYVIMKNINAIEQRLSIVLGLKLWKSSVYMFSKIPAEIDWSATWHIVFWAVIAAAVGTLIPSVVAARTSPVDILRYE